MKKYNPKKIYISVMLIISLMFNIAMPNYAIWGKTERGGIFWVTSNNEFYKDGWKLIDDDNDGIGYYYYFNENGFVLLDDITPDYQVVNKAGRKINADGEEVAEKIENLTKADDNSEVYSDEIMAQIKADQGDVTSVKKGVTSSGQVIHLNSENEETGPKPSDNIVIETNPDGSARTILGENVVLKEKKETRYDTTISKKMVDYIKSGTSYSKKVNGKTFTKNNWKGVMALKGNGAKIVFENPKNNFNIIKGKIATHYFSYSDRTTTCTLYFYDDETNEELGSIADFNYNAGSRFECIIFQKTNRVRLELEVTGQYTSRVCYLKDCEYGFDRQVYEDEQYEKEIEEQHRLIYGTDSEVYSDEEEYMDENDGEWSIEGEDPVSRYKRINGLEGQLLITDYDEDDDSVTEAERASLSELRRRQAEEAEARDKITGPAYDKKLMSETEALGPTGLSNIIPAKAEGGE